MEVDTIADSRGWLSPIHFASENFLAVRAFIVSAPNGVSRGGHGHARTRQIFMLVTGGIQVEMSDGNTSETHLLDSDNRALLIEKGIWTQQTFQGDNAAMVVFCDEEYDPEDYLVAKSALADGTGGAAE